MFVYSPNKQSLAESPVRPDDVRAHNSALLLRLLWADEEGSARVDLARQSGLSRATISAIVGDLLETGLVQEGAQRASRGGRPATVLRFHDGAGTLIGVELGASHISIVRTDLRCTILDSFAQDHDVQGDPVGALALLGALLDRFCAAAEAPVLGIGLGVPSPLRRDQPGRMSANLLPRWADIDLLAWTEARCGLPVRMDNDANLGALAEHWWGAGRGIADFAYVKVATGVGAGVIIAGDIYRGAGGVAGEIGHTAIDPEGPRCRCGLKGCLEALVGTQYLLERATERAACGKDRPRWAQPHPSLAGLIAAARAGDPAATELISTTGHWLGIAVSNLLNLVNPSRIVLGGRLTAAGDLLLTPLRAALDQRALWTSAEGAEVVISSLPQEAVALGAATLVLQDALSDPRPLLAGRSSTAVSAAR